MSNYSGAPEGTANKEKTAAPMLVDANEPGDDPCDKAAVINALIKEYTELKAQISKVDDRVQYWRVQEAKLSVSNWTAETQIKELQNMESHVKEIYMRNVEVDEARKKELKELKENRAKTWKDKWDSIHSEIAMYAEKLHRAGEEYSTENLANETAKYREESAKMCAENEELRRTLKDLEAKIGLNDLAANKDSLSSLATVISDLKARDANLERTITKLEGTLQELQNKVSACKKQLNDGDKSKMKSRLS